MLIKQNTSLYSINSFILKPFIYHFIKFIRFFNLNKMITVHFFYSAFTSFRQVRNPLFTMEIQFLFTTKDVENWNFVQIKFQRWHMPKELVVIRVAKLSSNLLGRAMFNSIPKHKLIKPSSNWVSIQKTLGHEHLI